MRKSRIKEMMQKEEEFASKESMHVKGILGMRRTKEVTRMIDEKKGLK